MSTPMSVRGFCPLGCGETLVLLGEEVMCFQAECPNPYAVTAILGDQETEHVVRVDDGGATIRHPIRERIEDALMDCHLTLNWRARLKPYGLYRVTGEGTGWERIEGVHREGTDD
jgi:hypothetical protein